MTKHAGRQRLLPTQFGLTALTQRVNACCPAFAAKLVSKALSKLLQTLLSSSRTVWTGQSHSQQHSLPTDCVDFGTREASRATLNGDSAVDVEEDLGCIPATKGKATRSKYQVFGEPNSCHNVQPPEESSASSSRATCPYSGAGGSCS